MLTFEQYGVDFASPNFSSEIHGDELKPLMSIVVEAVVHATNLESFKPGITDALWKRPAANDSERLDDAGKLHDLVKRFGTAKALSFEDKFPGYQLVVHKSELFDDTREWPEVEVGKISVEAENGGSARVKMRLQIRDESDELAWWVQMMGRSAQITLLPPHKPLPPEHPDAPKDAEPLAGSLEFGRDAQDSHDASDDTGAPEGLDAARLAEAAKDAAEMASRKADQLSTGPKGRRGRKASEATPVH